MMLRHMNLSTYADRIENAILGTIAEGKVSSIQMGLGCFCFGGGKVVRSSVALDSQFHGFPRHADPDG
jgi:hypothetical protein